MPDKEGSGQPRYCTSCGAQITPDNAFCTSCGASIPPPRIESEGVPPQASFAGEMSLSSSASRSVLKEVLGPVRRLSIPSTSNLQGLLSGTVRWFGRLPAAIKVVLTVLVLLSLLVLLSPIGPVVAAVMAGVSIIALIARVAQHKSTMGWGITLATSLILTLLLSGISGILDSGNSTEDIVSNRGDPTTREAVGGEDDYEVPVDVYLIEQDPFFMEGYLAVNLDDDDFIASNWLGNTYISGDVFPDGGLYWNGNQIGDLDNYEYACTYEGDDPRGFEEAMQEACGFAPSVED